MIVQSKKVAGILYLISGFIAGLAIGKIWGMYSIIWGAL